MQDGKRGNGKAMERQGRQATVSEKYHSHLSIYKEVLDGNTIFSPLKKKVGKKGGSPIFPIQSYCSGKLLPINSNYCSIQSQ